MNDDIDCAMVEVVPGIGRRRGSVRIPPENVTVLADGGSGDDDFKCRIPSPLPTDVPMHADLVAFTGHWKCIHQTNREAFLNALQINAFFKLVSRWVASTYTPSLRLTIENGVCRYSETAGCGVELKP